MIYIKDALVTYRLNYKFMDEKEKKTIKTAKATKSKGNDYGINVEDMASAGVYFGHRVSKCHPKMKPYIIGVKGSDHINIIDLEKTKELFIQALDYIKNFVKQGKVILFVGTKLPTRALIQDIAEECKFPYVTNRWLGGTITNFQIIKKRIDYFNDLREKRSQGELEKYTKKEQLEIDRNIEKLDLKIGGIKDIKKLPDAIFVVDMKKDAIAVKEARAQGIPIIAIADTEVNPSLVDYPIPANDNAVSSVKYILEKIKKVILKNKSENKLENKPEKK